MLKQQSAIVLQSLSWDDRGKEQIKHCRRDNPVRASMRNEAERISGRIVSTGCGLYAIILVVGLVLITVLSCDPAQRYS